MSRPRFPCEQCGVIFLLEVFFQGHRHGVTTTCPRCLIAVHALEINGRPYCGRCNGFREDM